MVRDGDKTDFSVKEAGSLYFHNRLCVPDDKELKKKLLFEAYNTVFTIHPRGNKMYHDLKQHYWSKGMKRYATEYVSKCLTCQQVKAEHQVPTGLLNPLPIPQWKWDNITMDFVLGFPLTQQKHDSVWVIVDRLTKSAHFIPVRIDYSMDRLAELYVNDIVRLHGVPLFIVSDRDPRFTSRFSKELQLPLGTRLNFSTTFHPQTDGQSERLIQVLEDMLRGCVMEFTGSWDMYILLIKFAYNNSYQSSIGIAPYEALYGQRCRTPVCWTELNEHKMIGPDIVKDTEEKVRVIQQRLKATNDRQKTYADLKRKDIEYEVGDKVFIKVSPWRKILRFCKKRKLSPRFIGPYEILERIGHVAYRLALPSELAKLHNVFHVSLLRKYRSDGSHILPVQEIKVHVDFLYDEEPKAILAREV